MRQIDWDDQENWGGHITESTSGSWLDAEPAEVI